MKPKPRKLGNSLDCLKDLLPVPEASKLEVNTYLEMYRLAPEEPKQEQK